MCVSLIFLNGFNKKMIRNNVIIVLHFKFFLLISKNFFINI